MNSSVSNLSVTFPHPLNNNTGDLTFFYVITASYIINFFLSLPMHSYIIWLICKDSNGVTAEIFTLNISVVDMIFCFSSVVWLVMLFFPNSFTIMGFFTGLGSTGRPLFQSIICVERYLAVVHPVTFLKYKPLRYKVASSALAWLIVLGFGIYSMLCIHLTSLYSQVYAIELLIFFSIKSFCCLAILRVLKQPQPGEGGRHKEGTNQSKKKAFYVVLIILISVVICYVPSLVVMAVQKSLTPENFYLLWSLCFALYVLTGFVQPLLYLHRAGKLPFIKFL